MLCCYTFTCHCIKITHLLDIESSVQDALVLIGTSSGEGKVVATDDSKIFPSSVNRVNLNDSKGMKLSFTPKQGLLESSKGISPIWDAAINLVGQSPSLWVERKIDSSGQTNN